MPGNIKYLPPGPCYLSFVVCCRLINCGCASKQFNVLLIGSGCFTTKKYSTIFYFVCLFVGLLLYPCIAVKVFLPSMQTLVGVHVKYVFCTTRGERWISMRRQILTITMKIVEAKFQLFELSSSRENPPLFVSTFMNLIKRERELLMHEFTWSKKFKNRFQRNVALSLRDFRKLLKKYRKIWIYWEGISNVSDVGIRCTILSNVQRY